MYHRFVWGAVQNIQRVSVLVWLWHQCMHVVSYLLLQATANSLTYLNSYCVRFAPCQQQQQQKKKKSKTSAIIHKTTNIACAIWNRARKKKRMMTTMRMCVGHMASICTVAMILPDSFRLSYSRNIEIFGLQHCRVNTGNTHIRFRLNDIQYPHEGIIYILYISACNRSPVWPTCALVYSYGEWIDRW